MARRWIGEIMVSKFIKRPIVIEAIQYTGENDRELVLWSDLDVIRSLKAEGKKQMSMWTLEGNMVANPGDWIIKGIKGEFYPCKPDIFKDTYERVN